MIYRNYSHGLTLSADNKKRTENTVEKNIFGVKIMAVIAGTLILAMTACSTSSDQGKKEAASADSAAETVM